jgi:hypothetical protein
VPTQLVNLDAMIPREDFEERQPTGSTGSRRISEIRLEDLEQGRPMFATLRKPDFQRVTANWSPEKVADLVTSFINAEFVPSLIMWESTLNGKLFVIDGAHRLSALMAWVNNDYGDGAISRAFFSDDGISDTQRKYARQTAELIRKIGTYADLRSWAQYPDRAPNEEARVTARKVFTSKLDLQWVIGDAVTAERSFFKINVSATTIDDTEFAILKARRLPNAIATRALIHAGRGHKFWVKFAESEQREIERLAQRAHEVLFKPILENPITTTELPIAGGSYSAQSFRMLIDLVNMVNDVTPRMWMESAGGTPKTTTERLPEDATGNDTIRFLSAVTKAAELISGREPRSLGLHPVVYFYGANGLFQPSALLATVKFVRQLERNNGLIEFTAHRYEFEEFLVHHRHYLNQLAKSKGSRTRPVESLLGLYEIVLREVMRGKNQEEIAEVVRADPRLKDLEAVTDEERPRRRFSKEIRSAAYLKAAIDSPVRCEICRARMRSQSISADHRQRQEDGGDGSLENLALTHFFCNTGYKEHMTHKDNS